MGDEHRHEHDGAHEHPHEATDVSSVDEVMRLVRAGGGRSTTPRRHLAAVLLEHPEHLTADELAAEVRAIDPEVHLSTIYRNLEELERLGIVVRTHLGQGPASYHLVGQAHGHLVCDHCGTTFLASDAIFEALCALAAEEFDFEVEPHRFAVLGRCGPCRARDAEHHLSVAHAPQS